MKRGGAQPVESCVYDVTALFAVLAEVYQTVMFGERRGMAHLFYRSDLIELEKTRVFGVGVYKLLLCICMI